MLRNFTARSALIILALLVGLGSVVVQSLPAGSILCVEQGGHVALESTINICCQSMIDVNGDGIPDPCSPESGVVSCKRCVDIYLPHDRFDLGQTPSVFAPTVVSDLPLIAIIDWPVARMTPPRRSCGAPVRPPHLIQIAAIVIRC